MKGPRVIVDGREVVVAPGTSVAAAIARAGGSCFCVSPSGMPRAPLCGMGICFECRVVVDGRSNARSCLVTCRDGMQVVTSDV